MQDIPLKVLVVDPQEPSAEMLGNTLQHFTETVISVDYTVSVTEAEAKVLQGGINTVYIDPLSLGLDEASEFIFTCRRNYPSIVFVLYLDFDQLESRRAEFFKGDRRRFGHYFRLNKRTSVSAFGSEVQSTIRRVQGDLSYNLTEDKINDLQNELSKLQEGDGKNEQVTVPVDILQDIQRQLTELKPTRNQKTLPEISESVFLSYRFAETEYVEGLSALLEKDGFSITTGQDANTYISTAVLDRIRSCQFFLCLMTRADEKADGTFTTSPWLLEEKGAALAFGKKIVLMVEDGVTDVGGLQGDWQRIHFSPKGFTTAAIKAVEQLKSYLGSDA